MPGGNLDPPVGVEDPGVDDALLAGFEGSEAEVGGGASDRLGGGF